MTTTSHHQRSAAGEQHLLLVTYHFPPAAAAAVYRVIGLVKYLRRMGWRITVLTVVPSQAEAGDANLLSWIPADVAVIRTPAVEPGASLRRSQARAQGETRREGPRARMVGVARRACLRVLDPFAFPDRQGGWAPVVAFHVLRFLARHPRAVVVSSSPPHSSHLGVRAARVVRRFPWVVDFRDPWTTPIQKPRPTADLVARRRMERWVIEGCDHVIANTDGNRSALLATFKTLGPENVTTVTNAFDDEITVEPKDPTQPALDCDLVYVGEIYPEMLDVYLEAVRQLVGRNAACAPTLRVFGHADPDDMARVRDARLSDHIRFEGTVSYQRSIALMRSARSLLLLLPPTDAFATVVPSKLYPYLFSARPIFAIVPPGDASQIIAAAGAGESVAPADPAQVAARLAAFVERVRNGQAPPRPAHRDLQRYTMKSIAGQVDRILRDVSNGV